MHQNPTVASSGLLRSIVRACELKIQTLDHDLKHFKTLACQYLLANNHSKCDTKQLPISGHPCCAYLMHRPKKLQIPIYSVLKIGLIGRLISNR